jgi:hypothetical protein
MEIENLLRRMTIIYFNVDYDEREKAKDLNMNFDKNKKKWYFSSENYETEDYEKAIITFRVNEILGISLFEASFAKDFFNKIYISKSICY